MPKLSRTPVLYIVALLALSVTGTALAQAGGSWTMVSSPNPSASASRLEGVAAISANDIWAVGHHVSGGFENLAMHWNGSQWTVVPTPDVSVSPTNILKKVIALSSNDVWAVGGHEYAYTLHWNGSAWSVVNIGPVPGGNTPTLNDISAVSPNDIWAVGHYASDMGRVSTVIMHWNGSNWTRVPSPDAAPGGTPRSSFLWSVEAISANNVWAVGEYLVGGDSFTLIEHWNGSQWSIVPSPNHPMTGDGRLFGISALSATDIWAVGEHDVTNFDNYGKSLAMRWNGSQWSVVTTPHPGPSNGASRLSSVTALSANDAWAVGTASNAAQGLATFVLHWNGSQWSRITSPNVPPDGSTGWNELQDITAVSPGQLWAVGYGETSFGEVDITITMRFTGGLARQQFDMDGDGKTDTAVFRPSTGTWYTRGSQSGTFTSQQFGTSGDLIAPEDYDGDGKTDIAVFRPTNGTWYILNSSNGTLRSAQFGLFGDLPAPGDYDGDGMADISVYRSSNGTFYVQRSSDSSLQVEQWGATGDVPVMGDYDGDGKTDIAVFRPSTSTFHIHRSSDGGVIGRQFGTNGDVPVAGDYDGDGRWDVAVFRPSAGAFYILQSTNNSPRVEQFGASGDEPVPSAYVP